MRDMGFAAAPGTHTLVSVTQTKVCNPWHLMHYDECEDIQINCTSTRSTGNLHIFTFLMVYPHSLDSGTNEKPKVIALGPTPCIIAKAPFSNLYVG